MSAPRRREPRRVFLFSGHMIDRVDRPEARFPAHREGVVASRLLEILESAAAGPGDLGLCGGAAGGDLLFAEACLGRGLAVEILLPQPIETFLPESVDPSGAGWSERFAAVNRADGVLTEVMPVSYRTTEGLGLYSRHVFWLIERSLAWGADRLTVVVLWDGNRGDGCGGTADLVEAVRSHTDRIRVISPD